MNKAMVKTGNVEPRKKENGYPGNELLGYCGTNAVNVGEQFYAVDVFPRIHFIKFGQIAGLNDFVDFIRQSISNSWQCNRFLNTATD